MTKSVFLKKGKETLSQHIEPGSTPELLCPGPGAAERDPVAASIQHGVQLSIARGRRPPRSGVTYVNLTRTPPGDSTTDALLDEDHGAGLPFLVRQVLGLFGRLKPILKVVVAHIVRITHLVKEQHDYVR